MKIDNRVTGGGYGSTGRIQRQISLAGADATPVQIKAVQVNAEQKAELAKREADFDKRVQQVEQSKHIESREIYLSNVSDLSLEHARKTLGIVEVMAKTNEARGMNVHGRYGDKTTSDLNTYMSWLKECISKYESISKYGAGATEMKGEPASAPLLPRSGTE